MKILDTVPEDIDLLFHEGTNINEQNLKGFLDNIEKLLRLRLTKKDPSDNKPKETVRMSRLGTPNRKLWFEHNFEKPDIGMASNALKFVYGDIIEQLVIFLLKEAGHSVTDEQEEVEIDGVLGHTDCNVDGYTVDIKSASSFAFKKFAQGTLYKDDPFGYMAQLSAYMHAKHNTNGAFIAVNKENGQITVLKVDAMDMLHPPTRIKEIREVLQAPIAPTKKCYEPEPMGQSGNLELATSCTYCPFKDMCWADANEGKGIRRFKYAAGIKELVQVVSTPKVDEVLPNGGQ